MTKNKRKEKEHFTKGNAEIDMAECNYDIERAIRKLRRKLKNEGLFEKLREKESYEKPSDRKRRKKNLSKYKSSKKNNTFED